MSDENQEVHVFQRLWQDEIDRRDDIINSYKTLHAQDQAEIERLTKVRDNLLEAVKMFDAELGRMLLQRTPPLEESK
jgi:hypothetical protein